MQYQNRMTQQSFPELFHDVDKKIIQVEIYKLNQVMHYRRVYGNLPDVFSYIGGL